MSGADYFSYTPLVASTLARAGDVNSRVAAIQGGFAKLPAPTKLQQGRATAVLDLGASNTLVVALDFAPASYEYGLELTVKVAATNTGGATINVNGLGPVAILRADGSTLQPGDLTAAQIVKLIFDGAYFRLLGASETAIAVSVTAAAASAAAAAVSATSAAASATAAAGSATNAASSATAAAASATSAAAAVSGYVAKVGATMTGPLILSGDPTTALGAATKQYVDGIAIAAGSFTADGATITLSAGQFALTTIATNRLLGNVSGSLAKPGAITGTQATALLDPFTTTLKGVVPAPGTASGKVLGDGGAWVSDIIGNAASATKLASARTIAISGAVTGTGTAFDGSGNITIPITALDVGAATTGTLAVARGGTGTTSATGTGNLVLSNAPSLTGNLSVGGAVLAGGSISLTANSTSLNFKDANGSVPFMWCQSDNNFVFYGTSASGAQRPIFNVLMRSDTYPFNIPVGVTTLAPGAGDSSTRVPTTAWANAAFSPLFASIQTTGASYTIGSVNQGNIARLIGSGGGTVTADSTAPAGLECDVFNRSSGTWTFACAGGCYLNGAVATVTSINLAAGAQVSLLHEGSGVWSMVGTGAS